MLDEFEFAAENPMAGSGVDGVQLNLEASPNPMFRQTTRTIKRSEEIQEITVEFRRQYRNQRLYNYNEAIARRAEAGDGPGALPWQTRAFIRTYETFKCMSADPNEVAPCVPYVSVALLMLSCMLFAVVISDARDGRITPGYLFDWFLPRFVNGRVRVIPDDVLEVWGGATRCGAFGRGELWRVLTAHLVHSSTNHFCTNMIGLTLWGLRCEHRLGNARFALIASAGLMGGLLLPLAALRARATACGLGGAVYACMVKRVLDITFSKELRSARSLLSGTTVCLYLLFAVFTERHNNILVLVGSVSFSCVSVYLVQTHFASEAIDALIPPVGLAATAIVVVVVVSTAAGRACA